MKKIDSLKKSLKESNGSERFQTLNELFKSYNQSNFSQALTYANEYSDLALRLGDSVKIVEGGRMRAYSLMDFGKNDEAIEIFNKILGVAKRNALKFPELNSKIKFILNNAAIAYMYRGNYDKALDYHFQSLLIREKEGDKKAICNSLNNIGLVFYNLGDFEKAIEYYQKALKIKKEINDVVDLERIYINIGLCYINVGEDKKAIGSFNEVFKICGSGCSDNIKKEGFAGLGIAYLGIKDFEKAQFNLLLSLDISTKQKDIRYQCENLCNLSKIEIAKGHSVLGLNYLKKADKIADQSDYAGVLITISKQIADIYKSLADYENASFYQSRYIKLKDSIYSDKLIKDLAQVQTNYEERENIKTIADKNAVLKLKEEIIVRQQNQYFFIITITVLILGLASLLFWANQRQRRNNHDLATAKVKIEEQNKVLEIKVNERTEDLNMTIEALNKVNEELDNFIYKTSHDIRGPLATLRGMCNVALKDVKDPQALQYLSKLDFTAEKLNTILTRLLIVNQINQSVLDPAVIDIKEVVDEILYSERKKGLPARLSIEFDVTDDVKIVSDLALVKIILENLIDNAIKFHNNSERIDPFVKIEIQKPGDSVLVKVIDNGIGIHSVDKDHVFQMFLRASERSDIGGIGLYLSKLATEKIGGKISLQSSSDKGTAFHVLFPEDLNAVIYRRNEEENQRMRDREQRKQLLKDSFVS